MYAFLLILAFFGALLEASPSNVERGKDVEAKSSVVAATSGNDQKEFSSDLQLNQFSHNEKSIWEEYYDATPHENEHSAPPYLDQWSSFLDNSYIESPMFQYQAPNEPEDQEIDFSQAASEWDQSSQTMADNFFVQDEELMQPSASTDSVPAQDMSSQSNVVPTSGNRKLRENSYAAHLRKHKRLGKYVKQYMKHTDMERHAAAYRVKSKISKEITDLLDSKKVADVHKGIRLLSSRNPDDLLTLDEKSEVIDKIMVLKHLDRGVASLILARGSKTFPVDKRWQLLSMVEHEFEEGFELLHKHYLRNNALYVRNWRNDNQAE